MVKSNVQKGRNDGMRFHSLTPTVTTLSSHTRSLSPSLLRYSLRSCSRPEQHLRPRVEFESPRVYCTVHVRVWAVRNLSEVYLLSIKVFDVLSYERPEKFPNNAVQRTR